MIPVSLIRSPVTDAGCADRGSIGQRAMPVAGRSIERGAWGGLRGLVDALLVKVSIRYESRRVRSDDPKPRRLVNTVGKLINRLKRLGHPANRRRLLARDIASLTSSLLVNTDS